MKLEKIVEGIKFSTTTVSDIFLGTLSQSYFERRVDDLEKIFLDKEKISEIEKISLQAQIKKLPGKYREEAFGRFSHLGLDKKACLEISNLREFYENFHLNNLLPFVLNLGRFAASYYTIKSLTGNDAAAVSSIILQIGLGLADRFISKNYNANVVIGKNALIPVLQIGGALAFGDYISASLIGSEIALVNAGNISSFLPNFQKNDIPWALETIGEIFGGIGRMYFITGEGSTQSTSVEVNSLISNGYKTLAAATILGTYSTILYNIFKKKNYKALGAIVSTSAIIAVSLYNSGKANAQAGCTPPNMNYFEINGLKCYGFMSFDELKEYGNVDRCQQNPLTGEWEATTRGDHFRGWLRSLENTWGQTGVELYNFVNNGGASCGYGLHHLLNSQGGPGVAYCQDHIGNSSNYHPEGRGGYAELQDYCKQCGDGTCGPPVLPIIPVYVQENNKEESGNPNIKFNQKIPMPVYAIATLAGAAMIFLSMLKLSVKKAQK